ncbi:hypothetical protein L1887_47737 [Cichorium endivia]|nr:hypothetical protein L1887_47737 [Cichorium endivia]
MTGIGRATWLTPSPVPPTIGVISEPEADRDTPLALLLLLLSNPRQRVLTYGELRMPRRGWELAANDMARARVAPSRLQPLRTLQGLPSFPLATLLPLSASLSGA